MENQQWGTKYQQSVVVATDGRLDCSTTAADDCLNNGNGENKTADNNNESDEKTAGNDDDNDNNNIINNDTFKTTNTGNQPVQTTISDKAKQILEHMSSLSNTEKYLLYLKFFQLTNVVDPLRQPLNPLGSRIEISRTISWIKTHLEEDQEVSLPKQQVYDEYSNYCLENKIKSLSQADFGKVMKQVYPKVRARRLGTRGNSRYCYSGLRRSVKLNAPSLPDLADKPLSTEAPCTQSSLTAAAWLIIKEWSEQHFGTTFSSLQALAYYLVITYSVGVGTEAANQVTSATNAQSKDTCGGKSGIKHREMQLQLQKKIQQKNEVRERKRKIQSPKCDQKLNGKRSKQHQQQQQNGIQSTRPESSPTLTGTGESSTSTSTTSTGTGSTCTSPTQGKPICDKSLDFTQLPALPDFKSFQKPVVGDINTSPNNIIINNNNNNITTITNNNINNNNNNINSNSNSNSASGGGVAAKVPIPRLSVPKIHRSPQMSPIKKQIKNAKYKAIQPKPQPCDIASYNQQLTTAELRSQDVHNVDRFKERKCNNDENDDDCDDTPDFPLTRERLDSISNVDKDAMDEYLGTNSSQHEEELSKYFNNNIDQDNSDKLSQLRHLLEQNVSDNKSVLLNVIDTNATIIQDDGTTLNTTTTTPQINQIPIQNVIPYVAPIQTNNLTTISNNNQTLVVAAIAAAAAAAAASSGTTITPTTPITTNQSRRRVSFETPQQDDTVPPSPNTRRKNFSFTPISPGPHSPTAGRQSKCSSTNVSPFVSPRNTPIPRNKNLGTTSSTIATTTPTLNNNNNNKVNIVKIKREPDLIVEIPNGDVINNFSRQHCMPQSAPTSPMLKSNKSVLQKLLNSNSKVTYTPDYINPTIKTDTTELCEMFKTENDVLDSNSFNYRSQSVPINQMDKNEFNNQFLITSNSSSGTTVVSPPTPPPPPPPPPPTTGGDFNDLDPISETSATVGRIIEALDEQPCDTNNIEMYVDINTKTQVLPTFNLFLNSNTTDLQNNFAQDNLTVPSPPTTTATATVVATEITFNNNNHTACARILNRSQSIDVNGCYQLKTNHPSRSVPTTPLPFNQNIKPQTTIKSYTHNSRSYPSTPLLINETPFTYNLNSDCLLNGQPIRSSSRNNHINGGTGGGGGSINKTSTSTTTTGGATVTTGDQDLDNNLRYFIPNLNEINDDNNIETHLTQDEFSIDRSLPSNEYAIVENENVLMDDGGVLIAEQSYNGNIN